MAIGGFFYKLSRLYDRKNHSVPHANTSYGVGSVACFGSDVEAKESFFRSSTIPAGTVEEHCVSSEVSELRVESCVC